MMSESLILKIKDGKLIGKSFQEGMPEEVVKELMHEIIKEWDPKASDLSIIKYRVKEFLKESRRKGLVYLISYKGRWSNGAYKDREVVAVTSSLTEQGINELLNVLEAYTLEK